MLISDVTRDEQWHAVSCFYRVTAKNNEMRSGQGLANNLRPPTVPQGTRNDIGPALVEGVINEPPDSGILKMLIAPHALAHLGGDEARSIFDEAFASELPQIVIGSIAKISVHPVSQLFPSNRDKRVLSIFVQPKQS